MIVYLLSVFPISERTTVSEKTWSLQRHDIKSLKLLFKESQIIFTTTPASIKSLLAFLLLSIKLMCSGESIYIVRKNLEVWLNYLAPSLSCCQKPSRVVLYTPRLDMGKWVACNSPFFRQSLVISQFSHK